MRNVTRLTNVKLELTFEISSAITSRQRIHMNRSIDEIDALELDITVLAFFLSRRLKRLSDI
jgi:hypothetical protein